MQVIHFSDPHVGCWMNSVRGIFDKRLFGTLNYNLMRKRSYPLSRLTRAIERVLFLQPQVLVLSGDVTTIGEAAEFDEAINFLKPVLNSPTQIIYVPGNHDHYCRDQKSLDALKRFCATVGQGLYDYDSYPSVVKVGSTEFLLLNEAIPTPVYRSNGLLNGSHRKFLDDLAAEPTRNGPRIVVGHYPLQGPGNEHISWRRKLINGEHLKRFLSECHADLALCGHVHTPFINKHGKAREICAGSVTKYAHINILDINERTCRIEQHWETLDSGQDGNHSGVLGLFPNLKYSTDHVCCFDSYD